MNLRKVNEWLTLLANFGVIAGLIFLGLEIQQNTVAVRASAIQESTNVGRQQILTFATNPDLIALNLKDIDDLNEVERSRVQWSSRSFWLGMQGLWRQWEMGVLPQEEWDMWYTIICENYAEEPFWPQTLVPRFIDEVESCGTSPVSSIDR